MKVIILLGSPGKCEERALLLAEAVPESRIVRNGTSREGEWLDFMFGVQRKMQRIIVHTQLETLEEVAPYVTAARAHGYDVFFHAFRGDPTDYPGTDQERNSAYGRFLRLLDSFPDDWRASLEIRQKADWP